MERKPWMIPTPIKEIQTQHGASGEQPDVRQFRSTQENHPSFIPMLQETGRIIMSSYDRDTCPYTDEQVEKAKKVLDHFGLSIEVTPDNQHIYLVNEFGRFVGFVDF